MLRAQRELIISQQKLFRLRTGLDPGTDLAEVNGLEIQR
jgi:hypothetical protein